MKKLLSHLALPSLLCLLLMGTSCALFRKTSRARVKTLIITGNYMEPRILAEICQERTKQPIFLFTPAPAGEKASQFYFITAPRHDVETVSVSRFQDLIQYLNPRTVVILGDQNCVPAEYTEMARENFRVMTVDSDNWEYNARTMEDILDQPSICRTFKEVKKQFNENSLKD